MSFHLGMGYKFLKHIERTRLLVMVVDIFGFKLSPSHPHRSSIENVFALNKELELYDESLFEKPCILLLNKIDLNENKRDLSDLVAKAKNLKGTKTIFVNVILILMKKRNFILFEDCADNECPAELASKNYINFERIIPLSAKNEENINDVKTAVRDVLDDYAERQLIADDRLSRFLNEQMQNKIV